MSSVWTRRSVEPSPDLAKNHKPVWNSCSTHQVHLPSGVCWAASRATKDFEKEKKHGYGI